MTVTPNLSYCEHGYCETEHCRTCEILGTCKCGHPKIEHDYFGCTYATCQDTCKRRHGSTVGKKT